MLASQLSYIVTPVEDMIKEIAHSILSRMSPRVVEMVQQSLDFSFPGYSRSTAELQLPPKLKKDDLRRHRA